MNSKRCGRKRLWPDFRYYTDIWLEGLRKTAKDINCHTGCPSRDSNRLLPEYKSETLQLGQIAQQFYIEWGFLIFAKFSRAVGIPASHSTQRSAILMKVLCCFSSVPPRKFRDCTSNYPHSFLSFPIHYSLIVLSFGPVVWSTNSVVNPSKLSG
jgi:hypothetical protein